MRFEKKYAVAVVGGGIAGVAAALAAARAGSKTVLIEKTVLLGGLATAGLIYVYLPLCDGNGMQVSFGIAEELLKLSLKYGPGDIPAAWSREKNAEENKRYRCVFSPAAFMLALDEAVAEAEVDVWLDTLVSDVETGAAGRLTSVIVENESGRGKISADCFIDASGSAVVARRAGAAVNFGMNARALWALEYNFQAQPDYIIGEHIKMVHTGVLPDEKHAEYCGINGRLVSKFVLDSRRALLERYNKNYASGAAGRKTLFPLKLPVMPQLRKIACIEGRQTLRDGQDAMHFADSVGLVADWRKPGYVWEIPYGTLLPQKLKGLLAAGRCTAAAGDAWEITRVIPAAALTGEVAGVAAALAVEQGVTPDRLEVTGLQNELRKRNFPLHLEDVGLKCRRMGNS